jgi:formylmethanofuran dehydrogenase subunit E
MNREQRRNAKRQQNKETKQKVQRIENALNRMPTQCDECGEPFDKKKHAELDSWRIAVYDEGPINLVCPKCVPKDIR